ncbi:hypothetical protein K432DRAFT_386773, partial [Lepidopterella palustris CBS 459.81]
MMQNISILSTTRKSQTVGLPILPPPPSPPPPFRHPSMQMHHQPQCTPRFPTAKKHHDSTRETGRSFKNTSLNLTTAAATLQGVDL